MRVFVTGATGFVGQYVVRELRRRGHEVHALVRKSSRHEFLDALNVSKHFGSLTDGFENPGAFDSVLHIAGIIKAKLMKDFFAVNREGTIRLIQGLSANPPKHFVYVSSISARGPNLNPALSDGAGPVSQYGQSKKEAEDYLLHHEHPFSFNIIRPPIVYGAGDRETLLFYKLFRRGVFFNVGGKTIRTSFIHVQDLAACLVDLAEQKKHSPRPFTIDDGATGHTVEHFRELVLKLYGKPLKMFTIPSGLGKAYCCINEFAARAVGRTPMISRDKFGELNQALWFCDNKILQDEFHWSPSIDLLTGFSDAKKWYEERGWL